MSDKPAPPRPWAIGLGEGEVWSSDGSALYWADVTRFLIQRLDEGSESVRSLFFDEPVVAISLTTRPGQMLVVLASKFIYWWPAKDMRADHEFQLEGAPHVRFNDGRADPLENFWVRSMKNNVLPDGESGEAGSGEGILYRLTPSGATIQWREGLGISNMVCWSPDRKTFYFGDPLENELFAYDYDGVNGTIGNERRFFSGFNRGLPDGSAVGSEGYLWNCGFAGGCIIRISPEGKLDRVIEMPVQNITTRTFGGPDFKRVYITTTAILSPPGSRLAGSLFALDLDVPGLSENAFRLIRTALFKTFKIYRHVCNEKFDISREGFGGRTLIGNP